jgi:hypothetical protein
MIWFPDQQILRLAVEGDAQAGESIEVYVTRGACIEAVNEIFVHARNFGQFTRRNALAGFSLLFTQKNGDTPGGG